MLDCVVIAVDGDGLAEQLLCDCLIHFDCDHTFRNILQAIDTKFGVFGLQTQSAALFILVAFARRFVNCSILTKQKAEQQQSGQKNGSASTGTISVPR